MELILLPKEERKAELSKDGKLILVSYFKTQEDFRVWEKFDANQDVRLSEEYNKAIRED